MHFYIYILTQKNKKLQSYARRDTMCIKGEGMLLEERLTQISQLVDKQGSATIDFLATQFKVSKDTIRRDLMKLEGRKKLNRVHGGAIPIGKEAEIFNYEERSHISSQLKKRLASKVISLVKDHSTIIFDSSTTVEATIKQLSHLTISTITNSLTSAILLAKHEHATVQLLPGKLNKHQLFLYGAETVEKLAQYHVDFTILGVFALSKNGLFIHTEEEGIVKRKMVQQGRKVIALADHTKINKEGFFKICALEDIDFLITDKKIEGDLMTSLKQNKVKVVTIND